MDPTEPMRLRILELVAEYRALRKRIHATMDMVRPYATAGDSRYGAAPAALAIAVLQQLDPEGEGDEPE